MRGTHKHKLHTIEYAFDMDFYANYCVIDVYMYIMQLQRENKNTNSKWLYNIPIASQSHSNAIAKGASMRGSGQKRIHMECKKCWTEIAWSDK